MNQHYAAVFSDLEEHSVAWSRAPREAMLALITEYRQLAESMAGQYGSLHINFTGDGHLFLYETADTAVQFSLRLITTWKDKAAPFAERQGVPYIALRLGCHFGECVQLDDKSAWVGRGIILAKRVEDAAEPDSLYVTESVLEFIDVPLYRFEESGGHTLKGDHLPTRTLYKVTAVDEPALLAKPAEELTAESWFLKGVALVGTRQENTTEEADCYREALKLRPEHAAAHNNLAVVLRAAGDDGTAGQHYREALKARPDYAEAHYNYALLLQSGGRLDGAVDHYREALRVREDYADAHHGLANLLVSRGDFGGAREHYEAALQLRPSNPEIHNNYAILLEVRGDVAAAESQYQEALRLRPDYPEAHYNYAILLENRSEPDLAEAHYREALRVWPDYPEAHNNLGILLHLKGDLTGARTHYAEAIRLRPDDPESHYNYGLLLRASGREAEAHEHFRTARELAPENPRFQSAMDAPS